MLMNLAKIAAVLILMGSWGGAIVLTFRLARYRVDRKHVSGYFARPEFGLSTFLEDTYTSEGKPLLPWLRGAAALASLAFLVVVSLFLF